MQPQTRLRNSAPTSVADRIVLIICAIAATACATGAIVVPSATWIDFFAHPQVDASLTAKGVALWRTMLCAAVVALPTAWFAMKILAGAENHNPPQDHQTLRSPQRARLIGMIGLIALGLGLRALRISESLWYDEIASWRTYNGGVHGFGAVLGAFLDPINHTLHTLLNRWSVDFLFPAMPLELAFRFPALVFSLATVPVIFGLGRAAVGERVGWIAATLAAIAPVCVLEGVEARGYAQMIFFSAAATWAFIIAFGQRSTSLWMLYALLCALGVWSQFVTAWMAIGQAAWLAWRCISAHADRRACAQGLVAIALAGLISILLYAPQIPGLLAWRSHFQAATSDQPRIIGIEGMHAVMQLGGAWSWPATIAGLVAFVPGVLAASRRKYADDSRTVGPGDALLISLLGLPLMLVAVALGGTWLYARFMLFSIPGALLAMSMGIDLLWRHRRGLGVIAILVMLALSVIDIQMRPTKQPLREAVEFVRGHQRSGDRVVAISLAHDVLSIYAYDVDITNSFMLGRDLHEKLDSIRPQWVIVEYPLHVPADRYAALSARGFVEVARLPGWADWGQGDILVFGRDAARDVPR